MSGGIYTVQEQGRAISIMDEGVTLIASVGAINFVGAGVTGSVLGNVVTETISGGGSSGTQATGETVSFSGTSGTLAHTPIAGTLQLYRGGARQQAGAGNDYTISGAVITLAITAAAGEIFLADYQY